MKKVLALLVALTLDERGIPDTAEGRAAIAERYRFFSCGDAMLILQD